MMFFIVVAIVFIVLVASSFIYAAMQPPPPPGLSDVHIRQEARTGNMIVAIRWYRLLHGVGLRHAKDAVEQLAKEES